MSAVTPLADCKQWHNWHLIKDESAVCRQVKLVRFFSFYQTPLYLLAVFWMAFDSPSMQNTSPRVDSDVSCKQSTLVRNEIQFIQTNLAQLCIDEDSGYGFFGWDGGTKGRVHCAILIIAFCPLYSRYQVKISEIIWKRYVLSFF